MNLSSEQIVWLIVGISSVALLVVLLIVGRRSENRQESDELAQKFGPEFPKALKESRTPKDSELDQHKLSATQRNHYTQWWTQVQSMFAQRPVLALAEADRLTTDLMRDCGYPVTDPESLMQELSVRHGGLVQHLRRATELSRESSSPEQLRDALLDYRTVITELLAVDLRTAQERQSR